jgi:hypothetical protein
MDIKYHNKKAKVKHRADTRQLRRNGKMAGQYLDAGKALHSPSAKLMELTSVDHMSDFTEVVKFLSDNLDKVIHEVHGFHKLLVDDGKTSLNCPPAPELGDSHGSMLIHTLSEKEGSGGITLKREFKVHDKGLDRDNQGKHKVEIREDIVQAPDEIGKPPVMKENVLVVSITRRA